MQRMTPQQLRDVAQKIRILSKTLHEAHDLFDKLRQHYDKDGFQRERVTMKAHRSMDLAAGLEPLAIVLDNEAGARPSFTPDSCEPGYPASIDGAPYERLVTPVEILREPGERQVTMAHTSIRRTAPVCRMCGNAPPINTDDTCAACGDEANSPE